MANNILKKAVIALFLLIGTMSQQSSAQLNQMGTTYFQNQYLGNPAMAGIEHGLNVNLGYLQQWGNLPGAPKTQSITADYQMNNKVGLGLNLYNDAAGLIKNTRVIGTFAYHLPLNNEDHVHFGISLGYMYEQFLTPDINGDATDAVLGSFYKRETYIDGDFGIAYTNNRLTVQGAIPNLKKFLKKDDNNTADYSTFFSAVSYKWSFGESLNKTVIEPKVCYRGVRGYDNMIDVGANVIIANNQLSFSGMYHSSKSSTFGFGFNYLQSVSILAMYTTENSPLQGDTDGSFEVGLKFNLNKKVVKEK